MKRNIILKVLIGSIYLFTGCTDSDPVFEDTELELDIDSVVFTYKGEEVEFDFKITPANIEFDYDVNSPGCQISLEYTDLHDNGIGEKEKPVVLYEVKEKLDSKGTPLPGQYTIKLKDSGDNLFSYKESVYIKLCVMDMKGELVDLSSAPFIIEYTGYDYLSPDGEFPVILISTPSAIVSKDTWTDQCEMEIRNDDSSVLQIFKNVNIKGRGNTTWYQPKKPYAIKLDKKEEIFGFPKHKRWVLLANYFDKTNLRNEIAFCLSRLSGGQLDRGLDYTPRSKFVRIIMNGKYQGLYLFTEQIKIDENRVDAGDDGFLVEIDSRAGSDPDDIYFTIPHMKYPVVIKDPDVIAGDENYLYIEDYLTRTAETLFSDNFSDPTEGYRKYIDLPSFIDWYIVNEITKNSDATFYSSCFMNLKRNGKLKMGPVWDFDLALGNYPDSFSNESHVSFMNDPEGFYVKNVSWFARIFSDPEAVGLLKERFSFFYVNRYEVIGYLDSLRDSIVRMVPENDFIWHFYSDPFSGELTRSSFIKDCNDLRSWLEQRYEWLHMEIEKL